MIQKEYLSSGHKCRVTFHIPAGEGVHEVALLGDFNEWNPGSDRFTRGDDGAFHASVVLAAGHDYRFRYLLDGRTWVTDEAADATVPNRFGDVDGLLKLPLHAGNGETAEAPSAVEPPPAAKKPAKKRASDPIARLAAVAEETVSTKGKRKAPVKPRPATDATPEPAKRAKKKS